MQNMPARLNAELEDRYRAKSGWQYMTGLQALVRLPIQQRLRDHEKGLNTGGFISGYRGSPIGRYDMELWRAADVLRAHNIVFQPGVNEDLAATSTWGTQYVGLFPGANVDGVFSIWYGKAPGMDRSMDPIRHANLAGTAPAGGTLLLVGDDHGAKSSTLACYSDYNFVSAGIPFLSPSNTQEILEYGLHGIALSRFAGCITGLKLVTDIVEGGGSVSISLSEPNIMLPERTSEPNIAVFRSFLDQERVLYTDRLDNALSYVRANKLNRLINSAPDAKLGIVASGKAWQDLMQGLKEIRIAPEDAAAHGIRLLKVGAVWPLDDRIVQKFAAGLETIIVIEEKRPLLEEQIRSILYGVKNPPKIIGKHFSGRAYDAKRSESAFSNFGETNPALVADVLAQTLRGIYPDRSIVLPNRPVRPAAASAIRTPSYCAGCPHGRSTQLPEGSRALAGIGCHSMAIFRDPERTNSISHMGGEGAMWIGQKPFTDEPHVFTNMGDGTYFHSGLLAIRAAVAADIPITYKLLYNGFISMTGGQPVDGEITPEKMIAQLLAEGVKRIAIVADDISRYNESLYPSGVSLHPRRETEEVQKELRTFPGVSVLLYDQPCATERRRLRKRGKWPDPDKRVFINSEICEGCGDCSTISQCMAIEPLETELGRKRVINQSGCNKDFSCVEGFCPSFVTVCGARPRNGALTGALGEEIELPSPPLPSPVAIDRSYAVLVAGIGGAGVVTIGQTLAMAAHVDGLHSSNLDVTGLAQKYGAVQSHIKFATDPNHLYTTRIATGEAKAIIGCDLVVTAGADTLEKLRLKDGGIIADSTLTPTADFSKNPEWRLDEKELQSALTQTAGARTTIIDAQGLAQRFLGDIIYANMILLGAAWQKGVIPLSLESVTRAIELNNVNVEKNKRAFLIGRLSHHNPNGLDRLAKNDADGSEDNATKLELSLEDIIADRRRRLIDYQNDTYADKYECAVRNIAEAEADLGLGDHLARAAARYYYKLLAHKDEWEVARLYALPSFQESVCNAFEGQLSLKFHVGAWPFGRKDKTTGKQIKGEAGEWLLHVFRIMSKFKFLRGSALDPFRNNSEAILARRLITDYESDLERTIDVLSKATHESLVDLLSLPEKIRGFGQVREAHVALVDPKRETLIKKLSTLT